jgi:hypothetical protein
MRFVIPRGHVSVNDINYITLLEIIKKIPLIVKLFFKQRKYPAGILLHTSETWMQFTISTGLKLIELLNKNLSLWDYYKYVGLPEETFFASVIMSFPEYFNQPVVNKFLIFLTRNRKGKKNDLLLTMDDWSLINSAINDDDKLFARKFSLARSMKLLDKIDSYIKK